MNIATLIGTIASEGGAAETPSAFFPEAAEMIYGGIASVIVIGSLIKFAGPMAKKAFAARTERIQAEIDAEGDTLTNDRGTVVMNPKHSLLETLSRRSIALCRSLQVHAHAVQGDSREQKKRAETRKGAQATAQRFNDEDLLAAPIH